MPSVHHISNKLDYVRGEIIDLKSFITDQYQQQHDQYCRLKTDVDVTKLKLSQFYRLNHRLKLLVEKYKEQRSQINLLVDLLRGTKCLENVEYICECGRRVTVAKNLSSEQMVKKEKEKKKEQIDERKPKANNNDEIDTTDSGNNTSLYTYSEEQKSRIGRLEKNSSGKIVGPLECLNNYGQCSFKISDLFEQTDWKKMVGNKGEQDILGRRILLPVEMSGATINVYVDTLEESDIKMYFRISFDVPRVVKENVNVNLPVEFCVQASVETLNGKYVTTKKHKFKLQNFSTPSTPCFAKPDNFRVPLNNIDRNKMPNIILTFTK